MFIRRRVARRLPGLLAAFGPCISSGHRLVAAATLLTLLAAAAPLATLVPVAARAETATAPAGGVAVQSTLYFGLKTRDGVGVSEQQWAAFLADEVTPRFPDGLTVVSAYGQGGAAGPGAVVIESTKVLIIVHPADAAAAAKISEIKAIYARLFDPQGVFHTETDVRVVP